ncbi:MULTISPECIES: deoxyribonuclease V [Halomonadaceae]|jgi:deoxyribonuclease V|uniref:Endonuclease V n=1 Tax=Vreelandella aquamarina TaxID=77097 RepID=A0A0D7V0C7_9GAMM|nr:MULTISPECIES: deoxyribonuclease V [Halomonas]HAV46358.1 deoxyribonuclease V [Halomonas sp.]KJD19713.1 endonuclease V [Halomonas meridiana]MCO7241485.1 deoxyribonuclease V [Halomonas sp. Ps84H-12]MDC8443465.1 deoxyribonuclease V [Halomonas aquamarina]SIN61394.1 Endonuclease V [Halomonas meridiana]|tara:strand:+ start:1222 stop:1911 length:690 start_codon:yes stop_codon:yes gene_type:complete
MDAALHEWSLSPKQAIALQSQLAQQLESRDRINPVRYIAGVDIGFEEGGAVTRAAVVVLQWLPEEAPYLPVVEQVVHREPTRMPYIPGLLSFREIPAVLGAFAKLKTQPQLVMVDGQGIAHPRRLGVAAHLGLWLDLPTIGIAKSRLTGKHAEVGEARGDWVPLMAGQEVIGAVLRSRGNVKPVFVSPGHRLSLDTSLEWVMRCLGPTKLPEPTRLADRLASRRDQKKR